MSVTALGMFGVDSFTPVINPPNAAILGVGRIRQILGSTSSTKARGATSKKAVHSRLRKLSVVQSMTLSLTWDHRVFDGVPAAEFCRSIVENLQNPESLEHPLP
jgi:pyruvate dehydrogenase E2 component (dihydrolipoamide acetyltransferase)